MELSRILITSYGGGQLIYLREVGGRDRSFPIVIGATEAYAIDRRLKGIPFARPLTHELLANMMETLGGQLEKIVINDLRYSPESGEGTFIATLHVRQGKTVHHIDSRPSDAIALGVASDAPIYVEEKVLEDATRDAGTVEERIEMLRQRMIMLAERIDDLTARLEDEEYLDTATADAVEENRRQLEAMKVEYNAIDSLLKKIA
jgi:hypothetical protein